MKLAQQRKHVLVKRLKHVNKAEAYFKRNEKTETNSIQSITAENSQDFTNLPELLPVQTQSHSDDVRGQEFTLYENNVHEIEEGSMSKFLPELEGGSYGENLAISIQGNQNEEMQGKDSPQNLMSGNHKESRPMGLKRLWNNKLRQYENDYYRGSMASMVRSTTQMVNSSRSAGDFQHNKLSLRDEALIHQIVNEVEINGFKNKEQSVRKLVQKNPWMNPYEILLLLEMSFHIHQIFVSRLQELNTDISGADKSLPNKLIALGQKLGKLEKL
jgi:hypothetical protein